MIVYSSKGEKITLANTPFSSGGEGEVRNIISPARLKGNCVKIYYVQKRSKQLADKIRFMVDNPPQQVGTAGFKISWPLDTISQRSQFIGFMMPLAFADSKKLVVLTAPALSKKLDGSWYKYDRKHGKPSLVSRLKLMNNIAIPIHLLHATGKYVLQDFKPDNVLITHSGQVTICDMDSIQITNGQSMLFRGTAATAGYAPPEYEKSGVGKSASVPLAKSWDNFALSVVFYQLLFGLHPYAVTPKMQKDASESNISTNVSDDLFPFGNNAHKIQIVPPLHDKFKILPPKIQDLFKRSFSLNAVNRPGAEEWGRNIHEILANVGTVPPIPPPTPPKKTPPAPPTPPKEKSPAPPKPQQPWVPPGTKKKSGCFKVILIALIITMCTGFYYKVYYSNDDVIVAQTIAKKSDNFQNKVPVQSYESASVIYNGYTGNDYVTCNGIYPGPSWNEDKSLGATYFSTNLGNSLNRNHFSISCFFWVTEHQNKWILMLSEDWRVLGINLDNGKIYISRNNQQDDFDTGKSYKLSTWNYISVEYNYGTVTIDNGAKFECKINTRDGNNVLSSINYSNGAAFKGYLNSIKVISYKIDK
jgi:hypothetical protein